MSVTDSVFAKSWLEKNGIHTPELEASLVALLTDRQNKYERFLFKRATTQVASHFQKLEGTPELEKLKLLIEKCAEQHEAPPIKVGIRHAIESQNGLSFWVYIKRTDLATVGFGGRTEVTPYRTPTFSNAVSEASVWAEFFGVELEPYTGPYTLEEATCSGG